MKFLYLDINNDILKYISSKKSDIDGLLVLEVSNSFNILKVDGTQMTATEILQSITYFEKRVSEYPKLEEQLDMIYKDMLSGTSNWIDLITSIKDKYPKEE